MNSISNFPRVSKWHITASQTVGVMSIAIASMGAFDGKVYLPNNQVAGSWQINQTNPVMVNKIENGNGDRKLLFSFLGIAVGIASVVLSEIKQAQDEELANQKFNMSKMREILNRVEHEKLLMDSEEELKAYQHVAEGKALGKTAQLLGVHPSELLPDDQPAVNVPAQSVPQQTYQQFQEAQSQQPVSQGNADGVPVASLLATQPIQVTQNSQAPQTHQSVQLPQVQQKHYAVPGVELINADALENVDEYPNIMIVAGKGAGKTSTVRYIFRCVSGKKVFASHKALSRDVPKFDAVFGYNQTTGESAYFGHPKGFPFSNERDLTYHINQPSENKSMLDFIWALRRELENRQRKGEEYYKSLGHCRVFFDEASYCYSAGFDDPFDKKVASEVQQIISTTNRALAFDGRSQLIQVFFAAQSKTVKTIGMEGIAETRDAMWFLFPGKNAIIRAEELNRPDLRNWLEQRDRQGYGTALIEKEGVIIQALNLPTKAELEKM